MLDDAAGMFGGSDPLEDRPSAEAADPAGHRLDCFGRGQETRMPGYNPFRFNTAGRATTTSTGRVRTEQTALPVLVVGQPLHLLVELVGLVDK